MGPNRAPESFSLSKKCSFWVCKGLTKFKCYQLTLTDLNCMFEDRCAETNIHVKRYIA